MKATGRCPICGNPGIAKEETSFEFICSHCQYEYIHTHVGDWMTVTIRVNLATDADNESVFHKAIKMLRPSWD